MSEYKVQLEIFEGPLDLLLHLVKKNEVDIYNIPIAKITTQYMEYLGLMKMVIPDVDGEFLVMGATLAYIKSKMLLPEDQQISDPDMPADEFDPRWDLIRQLVEYKKFKEAAENLQTREWQQSQRFIRQAPPLPTSAPASRPTWSEASIFDLLNAFNRVLKRAHEKQGLHEIFEENFTVSDKIDFILKLMGVEPRTSFDRLFDGMASRQEIIVTFLALLELIRLSQVRIIQSSHFEEIHIQRVSGETPLPTSDPTPSLEEKPT